MRVAIIDYGSGNLCSAAKAFERAAHSHSGSHHVDVTSDPEAVMQADRIVLPGVGAFADCRRGLSSIDGMEDALREAVIAGAKPFMGICVGMQLLASRGLEFETSEGLGWISGDVKRIEPENSGLKIPHMGWNTVSVAGAAHSLLDGIETGENGLHAYFVHSYHFDVTNSAEQLATFDYGGRYTAMVGRDNIVGTQFHPEKSQRLGLRLISNFLSWAP
ncbi:imidazole glycerol phosphate synthase subunit HisH [Polycladidibacter hongkongensis]|uniref:imidazole glycerol phosphate synthase subunit HisH n=1 Tax=Polycladidibacter hongkongensis TaxID=1647556 RepID=UPI00082E4D4A|nr:imidazole glycerol phosphate synthase subunit HisH [Pseudovibrio hongkongensis]